MRGDFLVFRYDGLSAFDVTIFDYTACEKQENEPDDTQEQEDDSGGSDDEEQEDSDDEGDDDDIDHVDEDSYDDTGDDDIDYIIIESSDESYEADSNTSRHRAPKRKHVSSRSAAGSSKGGGSSRKRAYNRHEWVDSDAELLVEPDNLYFIFTQRFGKRENQLAVPSVAVRDFNVELEDKILYRDPAGREYVGRVSKWKTGQIWIGGWKSFCKKNQLTADDKCICELVVSGGERKCGAMRVHIIRNAFKNV
uniref:TF-B3 domain-containing protein n=1 Tax=Kalanchoe fedtschenkoi TaxID=63787 RepID=A0A7N0ZRI0_KALFE